MISDLCNLILKLDQNMFSLKKVNYKSMEKKDARNKVVIVIAVLR